jgi:anti-sigma factor RsiW
MAEQQPLSEKERSDLVAYLDGELHGEAAQALEAKLQRHPEARAEADALKRTWELLDYLPRAEPSPHFTERTVSRLAPLRQGKGVALRRPRWLWGAAWAAGVVLAFVAGWVGYDRLVPREPGDRELVRDLRLIENKRLYDGIEDLDFLKQLDQPELFGEEHPGS